MNTAFATVGVALPPARASPHGRRPGARLLCASGSADRQDELKRTMEGLRRTVAEAKDIAGQYASAFEEEEEEEEEFDEFEEDVSSTAPPLEELFRSSHPRVKVALRTGIYIGGIGLAALFCPGLVLDVIRRLSSAMAVAIDTVGVDVDRHAARPGSQAHAHSRYALRSWTVARFLSGSAASCACCLARTMSALPSTTTRATRRCASTGRQ